MFLLDSEVQIAKLQIATLAEVVLNRNSPPAADSHRNHSLHDTGTIRGLAEHSSRNAVKMVRVQRSCGAAAVHAALAPHKEAEAACSRAAAGNSWWDSNRGI